MNHRPRIVLADDHTMLLDAFRRLLEPQCEIVGTACDGRTLIELALRTNPEIVVLDISMPRLNGMDACAQLRRKLPGVKFVFLTVNEDPDVAAEAIRLGASAYLLKSSASAELTLAIEWALSGRIYVTPLITRGTPLDQFLRSGQSGRRKTHRPPTRSPAAARRGKDDEGGGGYFESHPAHHCLPQIRHHGTPGHQDQR